MAVASTNALSAELKALSEQQIWSLLIHSWDDEAQITDENFLFSTGQFSNLAELEQTLAHYKKNPQQTFCRFPARISFLAEKLNFELPANRFANCSDLESFLQHVPFDSLDLVYASEVLSSATSMMGHIFVKASGLNVRNNQVEHSLAYFTEVTTVNPLKLVVESTMTGMPGFFSVRPYTRDVEQYLTKEQRNLWQFSLKGTPQSFRLLQLHIWELRHVNLEYFFQSFNCATLTLELLALLDSKLILHRGGIVSPADVVKAVVAEGLVQQTTLDSSPHWLFHALRDSVDSKKVSEVDELMNVRYGISTKTRIDDLKTLAHSPILNRYIRLVTENTATLGANDPDFAAELISSIDENKEIHFDLTEYKHPANTPQDSSFSIGWQQSDSSNNLLLHYLPTGHFLHGDNRQYLSESELVIAKTSIGLDFEQKKFRLEELTLYSVRSFSPDHPAFPVVSGEFYLGHRSSYDSTLKYESLSELSGAVGKSKRLHKDIVSYAVAGAGIATNFSYAETFFYAKAGIILNLVSDTKLVLQYEANTGKTETSTAYSEATAVFSWFTNKNRAINFNFYHANNKYNDVFKLGAEYTLFF